MFSGGDRRVCKRTSRLLISEYACRGPGRGSLQFSLPELCQKKSPRYLISDSEPPAVISLYSGRRLVSSNADCQSAVEMSPIIVAVAEAVQLDPSRMRCKRRW